MLTRALVVLAAYLLSSVGFVFMALGAGMMALAPPFGLRSLTPLLWVWAWVCHVRMSMAWVRGQPVPRRVPVWGTVAAVLGLLSPLLVVLEDKRPFRWEQVEAALGTAAMAAFFLSPCIVLAIWLVRHHLRPQGLHDAG